MVTSLVELKVIGLEDFLERQEDFVKRLQPQDQKAIKKNLDMWVVMPNYNALHTQKMARGAQGDFSLWESRMTKKIRLRFLVNEVDGKRMPVQFDHHDDRDNAVNRALIKGINHYGKAMSALLVACLGILGARILMRRRT